MLPNPLNALVKLLDRLSYRWKFASVAIVFVMVMGLSLLQIHANYRTQIATTETKTAGLKLTHDAVGLLVNFQLLRGKAYIALLGGDRFEARLPQQTLAVRNSIDNVDATLATHASLHDVQPRWARLRTRLEDAIQTTDGRSTAQNSFDTYTEVVQELLAWLVDIGDVSGLSADTQNALYHLNNTQVRILPEFVESIAALRGFGAGNFLAEHLDARVQLALTSRLAAVNITASALRTRLDHIVASESARGHFAPPELKALHETVRYVRNTASYGIATGTTSDAFDFFDVATRAIDHAVELHQHILYPASLALLNARLDETRRHLYNHVAAYLAVFLLIATLFAAMYLSIRRSVAALSAGSARFAAGALDTRVEIESRDELRTIGQRFNAMAAEITHLIDAQRKQNLHFEGLLRNNPSVVFALEPERLTCTYLSPNAESLLGPMSTTEPAQLACLASKLHPDQRPDFERALKAWRDTGYEGVQRGAYRLMPNEVHTEANTWVEMQLSAVRNDAGTIVEIVGSCTDITERHHATTQLELAASVFRHAREGITIADTSGCIVEVNTAFTEITGWPREEIIGKNPRVLQSGHHDASFYKAMWASLLEHDYWEGEIWNRHKSGRVYAETLAISVVRNASDEITHYVALFSDVTHQKENEQRLRKLAHYDPLTNLANRTLLADRLEQALAHSQRTGKVVAVVLIDLDGFKAINDQHGHDAGDTLLVTVSRRMKTCLRNEDTLARLGGDEFVAVLGELDHRDAVTTPLNRLMEAIAEPIALESARVSVSGSIGVAFYPQPDTIEPEQLLRQADQAMYLAKQAGKNQYRTFDECPTP